MEIASAEDVSVNRLASQIDANRRHANFSSAVRLYVAFWNGRVVYENGRIKRLQHLMMRSLFRQVAMLLAEY